MAATPEPTSRPKPWWYNAMIDVASGCVAGAIGKVIEYPFDTVKTFKQVLRNEGVSGIYRGMSSPLIGCVFETSCLFVAHGQIKVMVGADDTSRFRLDRILLASGLTGLMVSFVLTPIELIKCRMQSYPPKYHGPVDCVRRSVAAEGWRVLYKGHQATMLREFFGTACWFGTYEVFLHCLTPAGKARSDLGTPTVLTAGALGGMSYWAVLYPADTVKSAIQTYGGTDKASNSLWGVTKHIYQRTGLRGLYAGLTPTLIRAIPANAAIFFIYEWASQFLQK